MAVQHSIPIFFFHIEDHTIADDAGEIHQDVEFAEFLHRLIDEPLATRHR